ncbi:uncharacterized protein LOC118193099 [Stegodyphus dumicola]|uniref:uncharacterized protein LOC118193099 n=1 Tax=Stegodyphus dumicola TaxID=202533 RepID=UPI0015B0F5AC|nr:uncharacterized protein LOC118193099 [Stegodyphus dumicola]
MPTLMPWPAALDYAVEDPWREQLDRDGPTDARWLVAQCLDSRERAEVINKNSEHSTANSGRRQSAYAVQKINTRHFSDGKSNKLETKASSASDLVSTGIKEKLIKACVFFCGDFSHSSHKCPIAQKLTNDEKVEILRKNGTCFRCLQNKGHISKFCDSNIFCSHCHSKHSTIMCNRINSESKKGTIKTVQEVENKVLSNQSNRSEVYLQTLVVGVAGKTLKGYLRLLIDTGSQNTYISQYAAKTLKLEKIGTERIKHGLFGGVEVSEDHNRYQIDLTSLDGKYRCKIEALDQRKICSSLPKIKDEKLIKVMEKRGILINDNHVNGNLCLFQENPEEIHMLLGADTAAQLFTERIEHFAGDYVAFAFETKLGWTLMGKIKENANTSSSLSVLSLSLHVSDTNLSNLWRLDTLGISSEENKTKSALEEETRKHFLKSVKRDSSGRYEVTLPFILDKSVLSSNRTVAERHLVKTESKLINTRRRKDYEEIFDEWEAKDIIEVVTEEKEEGVHYLSHRPVIKESSETTKIRPVFNASARSKNSPSLNDCLNEAENFVQEARLILASGHFNLRCWRSNFRIDMIDEIENKTKVVPVLGLVWDLEKDSLSCKIEETFNLREPITKRKVLSITQKIFDPIGFTAPITVIPKLILQETWNQKIKWDEDLPLPLSEQFGTWLNQLPLLSQIEIPRWLNIDYENEDTVVLHVFSDASKRAYATCAFLRAETIEGVKVQLVSARSRIAPIKELTIPRLELLSCLIGARLAKTILSDLKLKNCRTVFWSDSSTALGWIRRDQAWGTFVHNRVQEIRSLTRISDWRHVPGSLKTQRISHREDVLLSNYRNRHGGRAHRGFTYQKTSGPM